MSADGSKVRKGVRIWPWVEGEPGHDGWRWFTQKRVALEPAGMAIGWRTGWKWKRLPPTKESLDKARKKWAASRRTIAQCIKAGRSWARMDTKKLVEVLNGAGEA